MKYLIYSGPGIGDFILILPMARMIKKNDPKAYINVIMTSDKKRIKLSKEMLPLQYDIDYLNYYTIHEYKQTVNFVMSLGFHKYDYGFVLQYTDNEKTSTWPYYITKFAAKITCGIKLKCKPLVKYDFSVSRISNLKIIDYSYLMLKKIGMYKEIDVNKEKLLKVSYIESHFPLQSLLKTKIISLVLGAAPVSGDINGNHIINDVKNWPYEQWLILSEKFTAVGFQVVLLGGEKEKNDIDRLIELKKLDNIINLAGACDITQSLAVICKSEIVIGADTGLMHCAGALKIPSLTLFGCTDPLEYLAYGKDSYWISAGEKCSPCFGSIKSLLCESHPCMKNLTVDCVFEKANSILEFNKGKKADEN